MVSNISTQDYDMVAQRTAKQCWAAGPHFCGPVAVAPAPPLTPSQAAARELVDEQDRAYEQARWQDQRRNPSAEEATPALVPDSADEEPSAEEMRRARLLRFGLAPR